MYTIYSFGDPYVSNKVFNSIAIIFKSDLYMTMVMAILVIGYVFNSFKSLGNGAKDIPIAQTILAIILFSMGFQTKGTVEIHNRYTSVPTLVENIPVAVAFPAEVISNIGYHLAALYEQALMVNDEQSVTKNGFLSPMKSLAELRRNSYDQKMIGSLVRDINGINFDRSMRQYATDCSAIKSLTAITQIEMYEQNIKDAMTFNSQSHGTTQYRTNGLTLPMNCKEAFDSLSPLIPIASERVTKHILQNQVEHLNKTTNTVDAGFDVNSEVTRFLKAVDKDNIDNKGFMEAILLSSYNDNGQLSYYSQLGATDLYENMTSSIAQRNQTWIAQGDMWSEMITDILTLIECLIYTITPFVGLGLLLGSFGMKMFTTYIQIIAVIQLFPVLNTIVASVLYSEMESYTRMLRGMYDTGSVQYMDLLTQKSIEILAYGGMLSTTMIPALAMALVTGSAMGFGHAIGGLAKTQPSDTDALPSQIAKQKSEITDQGINKSQTYNSEHGGFSKQTLDKIPDFSTSKGLDSSVSASSSRAKSAEENYQKTQADGMTQINSRAYDQKEMVAIGNQVQSAGSARYQAIASHAEAISKDHKLTSEEKAALTANMSMGLQATASGGIEFFGNGGKVTASTGGKFESSGSSGVSKNMSNALSAVKQLTKDEAFTQQYQDAIKTDYANSKTLTENNSLINKIDGSTATAYREAETAQQSYEETKKASDSVKTMSPKDFLPWASNHGDKEGTKEQTQKYVDSLSGSERATFMSNLNSLQDNDNIHNHDTAILTAALITADTLGHGEAILDIVSGKDIGSPQDKTGVEVQNQNQ